MLIVFYGLCVSLVVLLMRSRIVVYNISLEELRPILTSIAMKLDKRSRWVGDSLHLPELRVHLHVEPVEWIRNIQLTAGGSQQSYEGWHQLQTELKKSLSQIKVSPNMFGVPLVVFSGLFALAAAVWMLRDQQAVAQALADLLRK